MSEKKPTIRFKGFDNDWEQRKLGEVFQQTVEYIDPKEAGLELWSVTVENGLTPKSERYNREFLVKKNDKFKAIHPDEIVYNPMNMTLGSIGFNNSGKDVAVSGYYVTMKLNEGFDTKYFATWLPSPNAINLYKLYATGSLIERQRVQFPTLSGIKTLMPSLNEQKQIGLFFKQLDTTTALHQQQLENLKKAKKGYLQKMFPKNNEKVPEIRFEGFTDDWEQRKLGEVSDKVKDKNKLGEFTETLTNSAEHGIINQRDFFDKDISNAKNLNSYYVVQNDDFVYNPRISNFAPVGPIKRNKLGRTGVMSPLYYVFRTYSIDKTYLEKYFDTTYWYKFMKLNGDSGARADRFAIKDSIFVNMPIPYPSIKEQKKIGAFFKQLDQTITLHQRKLDYLKEMKKGLLQKMFV
ncbi:restriction endonuclease subunit S [uncultured Enterococcus sp.]|uniref:restriction endonuclease subunit S n=1 Tax=uncultured Enterococcus sp. TaxID=167972 RepID=UPI0028050370|nr:restriction endonuclease subunit S [uncultured Enterococcus sp.]